MPPMRSSNSGTPDDPRPRSPMLSETRDGATVVLTLDYPDRARRAIVITGAGGTFSAGGDISGMDVVDLAAGRERFRLTHRLVRLLIKGSKPVIAAVEGWCVGAGLSVAMCCDTVVAAEDAWFAAGFGKVGLVADLGLLHTLPARIGQGRARQVLLYGEPTDARRAAGIGMADHVVPSGTALQAALDRAALFHDAAALPVALTRQYLAAGLDAALDWERDTQSALFLTADHAEGRAAFLAKRAAVFKGV